MPTGNSYFPPFWSQEDLLWILMKIGGNICVHNMHVENKVHPFLTEVLDQKLSGMLIFHCFHWLYFGLGITCFWVPPATQKTNDFPMRVSLIFCVYMRAFLARSATQY